MLAPNLICKPATVLITKVTIKGAKQAVQMFGPAQAAVAKAVADSVAAGVISKAQAEELVIVCGVFIHWEAKDDNKIYQYNYEADQAGDRARHEGRAEDRRDPGQEGHGQASVLAEVSADSAVSGQRLSRQRCTTAPLLPTASADPRARDDCDEPWTSARS